MAAASSRGRSDEIQLQLQRKSKLIPNNNVVPVVYYLSRNGQLQQPHFMELPLSSPPSLFLRDVISRFNLLRGKDMASHYSWASKRSYKNGYVWHDLEENDLIHPVHGGEYVLKGSEILETVLKSPETLSSCNRRRHQSWGGIDLHEYKVYKAESTRESDASTQTEDKRRRGVIKEEVEQSTELNREEISPPPSDSSPETLESLIESKRAVSKYEDGGRMKASSVIMSLISCGSVPFRDCGAVAVKEHGLSLISHYKKRGQPRGGNQTVVGGNNDDGDDDDVMREIEKNTRSRFAKMALEDKEYFSGSLVIEEKTRRNKDDDAKLKLKRSSSCNANANANANANPDRSWHLKSGEREKCIERRPKTKTRTTKDHSL